MKFNFKWIIFYCNNVFTCKTCKKLVGANFTFKETIMNLLNVYDILLPWFDSFLQ